MSWLFSRALVEEYSAENSLDGEQYAQLNGSHIQLAYCAPDKMMAFSRLSRFGMMFKPLTETRGEELLTLFREGFHAKTLAQPEKEQELTESVQECGEKWRASFVKYDQNTHSWKTHQCSLLGDLESFSETWPQWGLMQDGECWEQLTLEQTIRGTESGLSPNGVDSFHTPNTTGLDGGSNSRKALKKRMYPTPVTIDAGTGRFNTSIGSSVQRPTLAMMAKKNLWPTPTAHNAKEGNYPSERTRNTPTLGSQVGGKLNPNWVEWLMNWPIKWSDINGFGKKEFERWTKESATPIQSFRQMRTMWWDSDPSQTSLGSQPIEQSEIKHSDSLSDLSRGITRQSEMERSHKGENLSVLRSPIYIQKSEGENLQSGMWEQIVMDETQIVPRISQSIAARADRLKAIGNGQVPIVAATAFNILK